MSDIFFEELRISQPKHFLNIHGGSHGQMTGKMIEAVEKVIFREEEKRGLRAHVSRALARAAGHLFLFLWKTTLFPACRVLFPFFKNRSQCLLF